MIDKVSSSNNNRLVSINRADARSKKASKVDDAELTLSKDQIKKLLKSSDNSSDTLSQIVGIIVEKMLHEGNVDSEAKSVLIQKVSSQLRTLGYDTTYLKKLK